MNCLRVFFSRHKLKETRYHTTQEHRDFDLKVEPKKAYRLIVEEHGSVLDGDREVEFFTDQKLKVAPREYVTIHSHSIVDPEREQVVLPGEKTYQADLLDPITLRNCLQDSPNRAAKRRHRKKGLTA